MAYLNPDRQVLLAHIGFDRHIVRAEGNILFDSEGKRYLDCLAQYGALPFGHNPACLWAAVEQARLAREPSLVQPLIAPAAEALAARLVALAPCDDTTKQNEPSLEQSHGCAEIPCHPVPPRYAPCA